MKKIKLGIATLSCIFALASCGGSVDEPSDINETTQNENNNSNGDSGTTEGGTTNTPSTGGSGDSGSATPEITDGTVTTNKVEIIRSAGDLEAAYVEWYPVEGATTYNVYYKEETAADTAYQLMDSPLIRKYPGYFRADAVGLKAGSYSLKVVPVTNQTEKGFSATATTEVKAHDRSGYGFVNGTSSGAYNDDGTLRDNAVVLYITENTKDSIALDVLTGSSYTTCVGLSAILTAFKKGKDTRPLSIRLIGNITELSVMSDGDIVIDGAKNGITFEGVGSDATANGWGLRVKGASNVEIRNLGFMNTRSGEKDDVGLQQSNDHIWVHNCDFFYGATGSDADQAKGDGALDTKTSTYITHSYNHFWDTGKSNLQGMKEESVENYITYHHNWYDHSDSRHPRVRTCTVHVYNNYYDGNSKYGVGITSGASVFVEGNYFRNCKNPMLISGQGTDALGAGTFGTETGGIIKAYNNTIIGGNPIIPYQENPTSFDAYVAQSRDEQVPSTVVSLRASIAYSNFDTKPDFYQYIVDTPENAKLNVQAYAGRMNGGDFKWTFNDTEDDTSYAVNSGLKDALVAYKSSLVQIQGETESAGGSENEPEVSLTAADVIALIQALPESTRVTNTDRTAIRAAETAYNSLDATLKTDVTNYSKLQACIDALNLLPSDDQIWTVANPNSFFTVSEGRKTGISVIYDGNTYTSAIKMNSSGKVEFTTETKVNLTLVFAPANALNRFKVNNTEYTIDSTGIVTIELQANTKYTIVRSSGESHLVYIGLN